MLPDRPERVALCAATYRAEQVEDIVILYAQGVHPTPGYQVFFERGPGERFPPQFFLWHVEPSGIVAQVLTPFSIDTSFRATDTVDTVTVHDANGAHEVPVEQALLHS